MENYFYVNGKKIPMSQETADSIVKANEPKLNIITRFPTEDDGDIHINGNYVGSLYWKEQPSSPSKGLDKSKHGITLYLTFHYGTWFDEDGNKIIGRYLHYKPDEGEI